MYYVILYIDTESKLVVAYGRTWEVSATGYGASLWGDEKCSKIRMC